MNESKVKNQMSKECVICGKVFWFHKSRKDSAKYCSRKCKDESQKGRVPWNKDLTKEELMNYAVKVEVLDKNCLNCGKPVHNKYCSRRCQQVYQNKQNKGKTYDEIYGKAKALVIRKSMSKSIAKTASETNFTRKAAAVIGKIRRGKTYEDLYGVEKAEQLKDQIRHSVEEFRQTPRGIQVCKESSDRGILLALSGKEFANTKKGCFHGVYFGSSLEEQFLQEFMRNVGSLSFVKRNTSKVVPRGSGFKKTAPDYVLVKDGRDLALIEVKSTHLLCRSDVYEKALALYLYGKENKIVTGYFTQDTLEKFEKLQGNPEPRRLNSLLSYMVLELYNYVVSRKVQRLSVEDEEANKTLKNVILGNNVSNDPLPVLEDEIVRYPTKVGMHRNKYAC